jgi:DNA polymerase kappa
VLTTANYVARKYGVRAAMPGFIAKKLCPELVFVKPDFKKYIKASRESRSVFAQYNP